MAEPIIVDFADRDPKANIMVNPSGYEKQKYDGVAVDLSINHSVHSGQSDLAKAGSAQIFDLSAGPPKLDNLRRLIENPTYTGNSLINNGLKAFGASDKNDKPTIKPERSR